MLWALGVLAPALTGVGAALLCGCGSRSFVRISSRCCSYVSVMPIAGNMLIRVASSQRNRSAIGTWCAASSCSSFAHSAAVLSSSDSAALAGVGPLITCWLAPPTGTGAVVEVPCVSE